MTVEAIYFSILQGSLALLRAAVAELGYFPGIPDSDAEPTSQTTPHPNIEVRKLPGVDEELDLLPMLIVTPAADSITERPLGFESKNVTYPVQFTVVQAGNLDVQTNLNRVILWQEQVRTLFYWRETLPGELDVPALWNTELISNVVLDRPKLNANYDYGAVLVKFHSQELVR